MKTLKLTLIAALLAPSLLLLGTRCASDGGGTKPEQAKPEAVADLCAEPARYLDQAVTMTGVYNGFRVADCRFPEGARSTAISRSDWLFRTGGDCLYVTGGVPAGIELVDPGSIGRRLKLTARVSRSEAGEIFLRYLEGALLPE